MALQVTSLTAPMVLASLLHLALAALVWQERPKVGATWFSLDLLSISAWCVGQTIVVSATTVDAGIAGYNLSLLGFVLIGPTWLVFALRYTGRPKPFSGWTLGLLFVEPVIVLALGLTNSAHGLVYLDPAVTPAAGATAFSVGFGPVMWLHAVYAYAIVSVGHWFMYRKFVGSRNVFRNRTFLILAGSVLLTVAHALSMLGLSPLPHHTLGPLVDLVTIVVGLAVMTGYMSMSKLPVEGVFAMFSDRAKSLAPLARNTAIEELDTGFLVIDHENRVVDVNPMGQRILGRPDERIVGKGFESLLPSDLFVNGQPEFSTPIATGRYEGVWVETPDGERRCFDAEINPLTDGGEANGRVVLIHDVTHREQRKRQLEERTRELERQNEQLDHVASIISHDLRNPLNVATGNLALVDPSEADGPRIETAIEAMDRMEAIIDDVLTLAKSGQTVDETESVDLGTAAKEAWTHVDTADATLTVDGDTAIQANRSRLSQVLENLFRNAVEHGGTDVAVTVGALPDGFTVADDGPGIPEATRETVFDRGYSSTADGTGLGLAIVRTIADAHGWTVTVGESDDGGARFEVTGVRRLDLPASTAE